MRASLASIFLLLISIGATAQTKPEDFRKLRGTSNDVIKWVQVDIPNKPAFVMLNPDYQVTPGDTYTIQYLYNLKPTSVPFFIEADFTANLSFFGSFNTKGMSFRELKALVEKTVVRAYPDSLPRLSIDNVGAFPVLLKGEVKTPGFVQAWGFSRVSDVISGRLSPYSSIRDIDIVSETGTRRCDLYPAALLTDLSQNPLLRPGDTVVVHRLEREVFVKGEVRREGAFQLLPGENLRTVLDQYCNGLSSLADSNGSYIFRLLSDAGDTETVYLDSTTIATGEVALRDLDLLVVPGRLEQLPLVFFEGALFMKAGSASPVSARVPWPITRDQRLSTAVANLPEGALTPVCDLERAFILRKGSDVPIPAHLQELVYDHDLSNDVTLQEGDRIVIPTKLYTVAVGGGVQTPGPQPFVAGKTYLDYVQMAGGLDPEEATGSGIRIIDRDGNQFKTDRIIQPEDKIYVPKNNPSYIFTRRIGPILVTLSALISVIADFAAILQSIHSW
jgi:polysaccharide export outer membrane protein